MSPGRAWAVCRIAVLLALPGAAALAAASKATPASAAITPRCVQVEPKPLGPRPAWEGVDAHERRKAANKGSVACASRAASRNLASVRQPSKRTGKSRGYRLLVNNPPLKPVEDASPDGDVIADPEGPLKIKYVDPDGDGGQLTFRVYNTAGAVQNTQVLTGLVSGQVGNLYLDTPPQVGDVSWDATPMDAFGAVGPTSDRYYFRYTSPPTTPVLLSPTAGATVSTPSPVLRAQATESDGDPVGFVFYVSSASGCSGDVATSPLLASLKNGTQYQATWRVPEGKLADGVTYYWCASSSDLSATSGPGDGPASDPRAMTVKIPSLGVRSSWPMWSRGPLAVNQATGNLVVSMPGPRYPTGIGTLEASVTYNSLDTRGNLFGLGERWMLGTIGNVPAKLLDHNLYTGNEQYDGLERVSADGSSDYYAHVGNSTTYQPGAGDPSLISRNADNTWTLTDPDGSLYTFAATAEPDKSYRLTAAEVSVGKTGTAKYAYAYDGSGRISSIAAKQDATTIATLSFNWSCAGALLCVTGPDGRVWKYVGDGGGRLLRLTLVSADATVTRDLAEVGYGTTSGSIRVETYKNANDLSPTDPNLSVQYRATHKLQIVYDGTSQKVTSVADGPIRNREGASPTDQTPTWSFAYSCSTGLTLPTPAASGHSTGWPFSASGCTELKPPNQQPSGSKLHRVWYDVLRHPLKTADIVDFVNGPYTLSRYGETDQLLWTEDEDGKPTDYTYDPVDGVLQKLEAPDPDGAGALLRPTTSYRYDETKIGTASSAGPALQGLKSSYYATNDLSGRPALVRTDADVDESWTGSPGAGVPADGFSVRWTGNLNVTAAADTVYVFSTLAGGGTRLVIDGVQAIDKWTGQTTATPECSPPVLLTPGKHRIALEFHDTGSGTAEVRLRWTTNTTCAAGDTAVPSANLLPAWLNQTTVVTPKNSDSGQEQLAFTHFNEPWTGLPDYTLAASGGVNHVTSFEYDTYGRLTTKWTPKANLNRNPDANGDLPATPAPDPTYRTQFAYYTPGEQAAKAASCGTGSQLPQAGLLKSITHSGLTARVTVYDDGGRPLSTQGAKGTVCRTYDKEGRLSSETTSAGGPVSFFYEPSGLLAKTTSGSFGNVVTERNEAEATIKLTDSLGAVEKPVYDVEGNISSRSLVVPAGAQTPETTYTFVYTYNEANQLTNIQDPYLRNYGLFYDARGNLVGTNYPTTASTFSFRAINPAGWLSSLVNRHGTLTTPGGKIAGTAPASAPADSNPLTDYAYAYFQNGQRKSEQRTVGAASALTTGYRYDLMGRLETASYPDGSSQRFCFDRNSNRSEIQAAASGTAPTCGSANPYAAASYNPATTPGLDELTSYTTAGQQAATTYSYNGDGDTTARGADTLSWDVRDRLTGGIFNGGSLTYAFDSAGFVKQRDVSYTYRGEVLVDNPSHWWRLGETSGTTAYAKTGATTATYQGGFTLNQTGALTGSGDTDKAVAFNGTTGYATMATPVKFGSGAFTVEAWFKTTAYTDQVIYFAGAGQAGCGYGKVVLRTTAAGKLRYYVEDGATGNNASIESSALVNNGQWHHAVGTRTGTGANTTIRLYLDGADLGSVTTSQYPINSVDAATSPVSNIGSFYPCNSGVGYAYFNGTIDEVALYKHAIPNPRPAIHHARGIGSSSGTTTTRYMLGGQVETDSLGGITRLDVSGPAGDLAHYYLDNNLQWVVSFSYPNGHGDLGAEANQAGTLTTAYDYTPFGQQLQGIGYDPATRAETYTASWDKKRDPASQLIEMGARPYDPVTGRFLATDPIEGGSLNTYDYAGQDPVNTYDLEGMNAIRLPWWIGFGAALSLSADLCLRSGGCNGGNAIIAEKIAEAFKKTIKPPSLSIALAKKDPRGEELKRAGADLLGGAHSAAARERWREWYNSPSKKDRKLYRQADGPRPRKRD